MILTLDIETIPTQDPEAIADLSKKVQAPGQYKKPESIAAWLEENREAETAKLVEKTSFDGALGSICCIGWKFDDRPAVAYCLSDGSEAEILKWFTEEVNAKRAENPSDPIITVGHNILSFDLRFLFQRYIINQVLPPSLPFHAKPWDGNVFDTMTYFAGHGNRISLDKLAKALGVGGKGEITGADVWPMFQAGRINEIARYCMDDVELTHKVYRKLNFMGVAA